MCKRYTHSKKRLCSLSGNFRPFLLQRQKSLIYAKSKAGKVERAEKKNGKKEKESRKEGKRKNRERNEKEEKGGKNKMGKRKKAGRARKDGGRKRGNEKSCKLSLTTCLPRGAV